MLVLKAPQGMGGEILLSLHNSKNLGGSEPTAQILPFPFHQGHSQRKKIKKTPLEISFFYNSQFLLSSIYFPYVLAYFHFLYVFCLYTEWVVREEAKVFVLFYFAVMN